MARKTTKSRSDAPQIASDNSWRARDALSTLTRAEEIRRDKPLMRDVKAEAKKATKALGAVLGPSKKGTR